MTFEKQDNIFKLEDDFDLWYLEISVKFRDMK